MTSGPTKLPNGASSLFLRLSSRALLAVVAGLFVADVIVPDALPFLDEIVLGVIAVLLARWQSRREAASHVSPEPAPKPPAKNVTPG